MESPLHLQTEKPTISYDDWIVELANLFAKAEGIDSPMAARKYINFEKAKEWYDDGFTPYATFRETYQQ